MKIVKFFIAAACFSFSATFADTLSKNCTEEILALSKKKADFDMSQFANELSIAAANIRIQERNIFSNSPSNSQMADIGLTVSCLKEFPESNDKVESLLKTIIAERGEVADTNAVYLLNGQKIEKASVIEVGIEEIRYKVGQRATVYVIRKSDVATVFHEDGSREDFNAKIKSPSKASSPSSAVKPAAAPAAKPAAAPVAKPAAMGASAGMGTSALSGACMAELVSLSKSASFNAKNFFKDLPIAVVKTKAQAKIPKTPFNSGPDPDDKVTAIGMTVGCLKAFPESPSELSAVLKDVVLKLGLDFAVGEMSASGAGGSDDSDDDSKSGDGGVRIGIRLGWNIYDFYFGYKEIDEDIDWNSGFGGGLVLRIPFTNRLSLNTGLEFYHRALFEYKSKAGIYEWVILNPVLLQFVPSGNIKDFFYLTAGTQFDIILGGAFSGVSYLDYYERYARNRVGFDIGFALGFGYIMKNIGFDFKYVTNLTNLFEDFEYNSVKIKDRSSLRQYGFGVTYLF
ncbi:MAG: PorT family protein [Fibromonadales bacterium]|nr:PorT family protein [Fibromonadales bacterium]